MKDDGVTRRDFLNGARVAIGASLVTPWAQAARRGPGSGSRLLPAGQDRPARHPRRRLGDHARPGVRPDLAGRRARGAVRPRGGRRGHQRAGRGALLPPAQAGRPHPGPRQPRRLRRPREAQRVHDRREGRASATAARSRSTRPRPTARPPSRPWSTSASTPASSTRPSTRRSTRSWGWPEASSSTRRTSASRSWSPATASARGRSSRPRRP